MKKNCWLKENLRGWNSQMKNKRKSRFRSNKANDGDNNCNINLIAIATVKIENNISEQI